MENKKKIQKIDRVVMDQESIQVIQKLIEQTKASLGDLVDISLKDMANFLIQKRSFPLTEIEISKIKSEHFDIVKALKQATQEAIKAKKAGHEIKMDEVLNLIQSSETRIEKNTTKTRKKKQKKEITTEVQETITNPV